MQIIDTTKINWQDNMWQDTVNSDKYEWLHFTIDDNMLYHARVQDIMDADVNDEKSALKEIKELNAALLQIRSRLRKYDRQQVVEE